MNHCDLYKMALYTHGLLYWHTDYFEICMEILMISFWFNSFALFMCVYLPNRTNYGVSFFQRFNLVLNALDNRQARNHVNRMCLTANIPLIESGTSGYDGQVELIIKGKTQCYECTPKAAQKSFPGCTIRNTPSEPIHCIVWAKHLFK